MSDKLDFPNRKKNRLKDFDYGQMGYYFVTLCTQNRKHIFKIESVGNDRRVVPKVKNQIIHRCIEKIENEFGNVKFDKYVIMPDHLHFIINITERHAGRSLQDIMRSFKAMSTNEYIKGIKNNNLPAFDKKLWQKSYYDHVIRNEQDYREIWEYIENNPLKYVLTCET